MVSDRCAGCFLELTPAPLGGHYACERPWCNGSAWSGYWSAQPASVGDSAKIVSKHGRPTLYYYGGRHAAS